MTSFGNTKFAKMCDYIWQQNLPIWLQNLPTWLQNLPIWQQNMPIWLHNLQIWQFKKNCQNLLLYLATKYTDLATKIWQPNLPKI
jgi:hypothetical protein